MSLAKALKKINTVQKKGLVDLDLSNLELTEIPPEISKLEKLVTLYLRDNQLTEIQGLDNLKQLNLLDLQDNKLTEIQGLDNLTELTTLNLKGNQIGKIQGLDNLIKLNVLVLNVNQITEIQGLSNLKQLMFLDLSGNHISEIKGLDNLVKLESLILSKNELNEIKGLNKLKKIQRLHLSQNQITEIDGLNQLTKLRHLYLWGNKITIIKGLENLSQLSNLYLSNNRLTEIENLESIPNLIHLNLRNNYITSIPEFLLKWKIPIKEYVGYEEDGIIFENNPITIPTLNIVKQGNKAIQEYYNQLRKTGTKPLNEAKLILLGDARSGKTSLANRMLGKPIPTQADRTQGVDIIIGDYSFKLADGKDFRLNIWDFAGHDKYKTLHQLFYTDDSLYVMVAESGGTTTDFDDWFQTAELFGDGSPLMLVLNEFKGGIGMGSFDDAYWRKQFPNLLKEVLTVNLGTKHNFQTVEDHIRFLAQNLPPAKLPFPSNWVVIRRILNEHRNQQYISLKKYLEICKDNGLPERESALILSATLHKIGDCLHYQKNQLLAQFIILKNEWATEAVYKILDDRLVAEEKCGFFDLNDVDRIWDSDEYRDMRPQLLELMKQFKLAYQLPGKDEFVTPPLLPPGRPAKFTWPDNDSLELYIDYEFLPKALLTQFIVTRHFDIADGKKLVWRHGVVLKWEGKALAEVSKTKLEGRDAFYIRTQGSNRKEMMTVILNTFRELHAEYKGIKYKEKVPCICAGCKGGANRQHYFDFANLNFRLERGRHDVECEKSLEAVNIIELLENAFILEKYMRDHAPQLKGDIPRQKTEGIRVLNVFLASSNELAEERDKIEQVISRKNNVWQNDGLHVELLIWENNKHVGKSFRSQDNYNLDIAQSNLFAMMFYSKVGKYTLEEYELASRLFSENPSLRICVFQKDIDLPKGQRKADADSRFNFLEKLREADHFPYLFDNIDKLVNELVDIIDKLRRDEEYMKGLPVE